MIYEKFKKYSEKIVSFGMSNAINQYKESSKQEKDSIRMDIINIKFNKLFNSGKEFANIFLGLTFIIAALLAIPMLLDHSVRYENTIIFSFIYLAIGGFIAMRFKTSQCNYILKRFDEIDMEDKLQEDSLKQKIAACNLFLK